MRRRLISIVIALAIFAFAAIRYDHQPPPQHPSDAASDQMAGRPAPEPEGPAIITAAVSASATFQTFAVESMRHLSPALREFIPGRHLPVVTHHNGKPRFVPLLI